MNVFRILADVSHLLSKCILIWAIHWNKSAEGVSLITQGLYALVFCTRYLDLFRDSPWLSYWNFTLKVIYITTSFYIIFLMMRVYARTREREKAWYMGMYCLGGSIIGAPIVTLIFKGAKKLRTLNLPWSFSIILESVCVLPQLLLLRQTTVPTVIDSFYLLALGSYRGFYILNWIFRLTKDGPDEFDPGPIPVIFGIIQTGLYIDFAWVYWMRQRVKLRGGGVVDSDDLSRGWLLRRIFGSGRGESLDEEERPSLGGDDEPVGSGRARRTGWGIRGISVSADEGLLDPSQIKKTRVHPGDSLARDDELGDILQDDDDYDDDEGILPEVTKDGSGGVISGGHEWRNSTGGR
ncbi:hypothetical protein GP486_005091 [Trichoglossum hirsutum]|uniref:ER lumen protein retaining receptor n=1 Tax=Trichoglossum hirsutum TaxID=265104 RepID=A0A9P8L9W7_9PEZI|nr:hypothetical protein GP486_005091 [Trichoglossum hirsutum]